MEGADSKPHEKHHSGANPKTSPVGRGDYIVSQGECLSSIARQYGLTWRHLWEHPENADLRRMRRSPHVLLPGDRVYVPGLTNRFESARTEARHRFVCSAGSARLRVRLLEIPKGKDEDEEADLLHDDAEDAEGIGDMEPERAIPEPCKRMPYEVHVEGRIHTGITDDDGQIDLPISASAEEATIILGDDPEIEPLEVAIGVVDPIESTSGVQQRLFNLGYVPGPPDGIVGPKTRAALQAFQTDQSLDVTGDADEATQNRLVRAHGS